MNLEQQIWQHQQMIQQQIQQQIEQQHNDIQSQFAKHQHFNQNNQQWQSQSSYETPIGDDRTRIHLEGSQYSRSQDISGTKKYIIYNIQNSIYQHRDKQPSNSAQIVPPNSDNVVDLTEFTQGSYSLTCAGYYGPDIDIARTDGPSQVYQSYQSYSSSYGK